MEQNKKFRYLFIVTYGRSGSTLLSGIINALPGYSIKGENNNFLYGLFLTWRSLQNQSLRRLASTETTSPWYGYSDYDLARYEETIRTLVCSFISQGLVGAEPSDICIGFKEIRWFDHIEHFHDYLDFLVRVFPQTCIIFNRRQHEGVLGSGWWRNRKPDAARSFLLECDRRMLEYAAANPSNTLLVSYDALIDPLNRDELERLVTFLGAPLTAEVESALNVRHSYKSAPQRTLGALHRSRLASDHSPAVLKPRRSDNPQSQTRLTSAMEQMLHRPGPPLLKKALSCYRSAIQGTKAGLTYPASFNKTIWMFWDSGLESAPLVVRSAIATWGKLNPQFSLRVLSKDDLLDLWPEWREFFNLPVAAFSDLLRVQLLSRYGGVWADATLYPLAPLDWWLPAALKAEFFAFSWGNDLCYVVDNDITAASWFLASQPDALIVNRWKAASESAARGLLVSNKPMVAVNAIPKKQISRFTRENYFWFHQEFTRLVRDDSAFRTHWSDCYEFPANLPHLIGTRKAFERSKDSLFRRCLVARSLTPMLKLSYKYDSLRAFDSLRASNTSAASTKRPGRQRSLLGLAEPPLEARPKTVVKARKRQIEGIFEVAGIRLADSELLTGPVRKSLERGTYERGELNFLSIHLAEGDRVLEAGGGLGLLGIYCALSRRAANIVSIEANPDMVAVILGNQELNGVSYPVLNAAAALSVGTTRFTLRHNFWGSSTKRTDVGRNPTIREIDVNTLNINDELAQTRSNFLIMDIEGGEADIVPGLNFEGIQKVLIEVHPQFIGTDKAGEVVKTFLNAGFRQYSRGDVHFFSRSL